ncbi:MAG: PIN domain-containing protein [Deltaproteobacteria bacterium]|nr:PIN domain-containing protein [Deltaproteobacteria bacterium]
MIWIDSSFAVEWLLGSRRAEKTPFTNQPGAILPAQYAEVLVYFEKKGVGLTAVVEQLEPLELGQATREELQKGASLYLRARKKRAKVSLADAMLGAVASSRDEAILSYDGDFADLGFTEANGLWTSQKS